MSNLTINSTARSYPALPYEAIKKAVLGSAYDASLVFVGAKRAQDLNRAHRQKDYIPNILSFPLAETAGEIYICPAVAKREAKKFNLSYRGYVGYLFIHGLLHLHGHDHGVAMDRLEQKYLRQFKLR